MKYRVTFSRTSCDNFNLNLLSSLYNAFEEIAVILLLLFLSAYLMRDLRTAFTRARSFIFAITTFARFISITEHRSRKTHLREKFDRQN